MDTPIFERDLLYPTDTALKPGSLHIKVYRPDEDGKLNVVIQPKTEHSPLDYLEVITDIIQTDIFERINLNVVSDVIFFIKDGNEYVRVNPENGLVQEKGVNIETLKGRFA